jgi:hypothetical protein
MGMDRRICDLARELALNAAGVDIGLRNVLDSVEKSRDAILRASNFEKALL